MVENTVGKGELLVMSNFSFSNNVFKRLVLQTRKNKGLFGIGLGMGLGHFSRIFDKMIDWSKFKAFADDNSNEAKMAKFVFDRVKSIS